MNSQNFEFDAYGDFSNFQKQPDKKIATTDYSQKNDWLQKAMKATTNLADDNGQVFSRTGLSSPKPQPKPIEQGSPVWGKENAESFQSTLDGKEINGDAVQGAAKGMNWGQVGSIAGAMGNSISNDAYNSKYAGTNMESTVQGMESTKDAIAGAIPMAGVFRGVEKGAKSMGHAIGGERGGDLVGGVVDPLTSQVEVLKNKDATSGEKIMSFVAPFASGAIAGNARRRSQGKAFSKRQKDLNAKMKESIDDEYKNKELEDEIKSQIEIRKRQAGYR